MQVVGEILYHVLFVPIYIMLRPLSFKGFKWCNLIPENTFRSKKGKLQQQKTDNEWHVVKSKGSVVYSEGSILFKFLENLEGDGGKDT